MIHLLGNPCPSSHQCLDGSCIAWSSTCSQTPFCRDGTNTPSVCGKLNPYSVLLRVKTSVKSSLYISALCEIVIFAFNQSDWWSWRELFLSKPAFFSVLDFLFSIWPSFTCFSFLCVPISRFLYSHFFFMIYQFSSLILPFCFTFPFYEKAWFLFTSYTMTSDLFTSV